MNRCWDKLVGGLLLGFAVLGRSFAYVGVPAARLFIGDLLLAAWLLLRPNAVIGSWVRGLTSATPITRVCWTYLLFFQYGVIQALRGLSQDFDPIVIMQELVFNVYPLYFFIGLEIASTNPGFTRTYLRVQAWATGIYGVVYLLFLSRLNVFMPGTAIPVFGQTAGGFSILAVLCMERSLTPYIVPICLNAFVLLGMQVRAEWVGFIVGLGIWALAAGRIKRFLAGVLLFGFLLLIGYATDFDIPAPPGRGGDISVNAIIGRAVAAVDRDAASKFGDMDAVAGTVSWRTNWWDAIWHSVHRDLPTALLGHAYGFRISDLVYYLQGEAIRTPHNDFYYALGYTGWIGVLLFYAFVLAVARSLWYVFLYTGQPLGLVLFGAALTQSLFGNLFETPFGAIPVYLLFGLLTAPVVRVRLGTQSSQCVESRFLNPIAVEE